MIATTTKSQGWVALAERLVHYVSNHMSPAHRGVLPLNADGLCLVFGNDCLDDERTKAELAAVRHYVEVVGIEELAFATSPDQYSWVMVLGGAAGHEVNIHEIAWEIWCGKSPAGFLSSQEGIAYHVCLENIPGLQRIAYQSGW